jgi:radical SAM superfamily enzyme YgiQ (UPF0313 family)
LKILLVYPQYPDTFWGFRHALKIISKKASFPPLGLLTVASMLPADWEIKLVDMNVTSLTDQQIRWADYVFISAMVAQRDSAVDVIERCRHHGTRIVAGGPLFSTGHEEFKGVDHFVLGEAEVTLPRFLADIEKGNPQPLYLCDERPDLSLTPVPRWSLINMKHYSSMALQYSRGCPFNCEFCDIIILNGRTPRVKGPARMVAELDSLYSAGWRGGVFVVDDNFIGNRKVLKEETLPAIIQWQKYKKFPFSMSTEASINLSDDEELMDLMIKAGFDRVFIGIETPNEDSLEECSKSQNRNRDLVAAVKKIQNFGFEVQGGFIVGFDSDPASIFRRQIEFIQKSGIVTAMVGLLNAPPGTRLYQRLKQENRLIRSFTGNNTDCSMNFIPRMKYETLISGYRQILKTIYAPREYYERIRIFLKEYKPRGGPRGKIQLYHLQAFIQSMWRFGILDRGRRYYWRLFSYALFRTPRAFPLYITLTVYGHHFRKIVEKYTGGGKSPAV